MARGQHGRPARPKPSLIYARAPLCSLVSRSALGLNQAASLCLRHKSLKGFTRRAAHAVVSYLQERGMVKRLMCLSLADSAGSLTAVYTAEYIVCIPQRGLPLR